MRDVRGCEVLMSIQILWGSRALFGTRHFFCPVHSAVQPCAGAVREVSMTKSEESSGCSHGYSTNHLCALVPVCVAGSLSMLHAAG